MTTRARRWLWLLALLPLLIGLLRLRFDVEVLNLLPSELPSVQGLKLYQESFSNARELLITLHGADAESTEFAARTLSETLRAATNLTTEVYWQPPWLEHPGQAAELIAYLWLNQPPAVFGEFTNKLAPDQVNQTLEQAREALATSLSPEDIAVRGYDPFDLTRLPEAVSSAMPSLGSGQELFASSDGAFRLVFVQARDELGNYRACVAWLKSIDQLVQDWRNRVPSRKQIDIKFTGRPAFVAEISSGMQRDMAGPSLGTLAIIALLFYCTHRRWKPLLWLLALLILILAATLALGGLLFGTLNVVSLGFASILLGLAEDFGIVLYQESRSHPQLSLAGVRREAAPGIFWSAVTTSGAFLLLNLSGLPGLAQLGSLVAIGIGIGAVVMLYFYLPPLMPKGRSAEFIPSGETKPKELHTFPAGQESLPNAYSKLVWSVTVLLVVAASLSLWLSPPKFDRSPNSLRPKRSQAYAALEELKVQMNRPQEPQWVVVRGRDEREVAQRLRQLQPILEKATTNGVIAGVTLPTQLWPQPENQAANRPVAGWLSRQAPRLRTAALEHGFARDSLGLTEQILATWAKAASLTNVFWPSNDNSHWILEKLTAHRPGESLAIGLVYPSSNASSLGRSGLMSLASEFPRDGVLLSGWELLGASISQMVIDELPRVMIPIGIVVLISLWLAFRRLSDVVLSLATLTLSGILLALIMNIAGWSWNMMNLMALPLLLGMGVDFSIHIQLALHRHDGNLKLVRDSIGRALLLAGSTTVAGFASVAFSSNAGIASLGKICAIGIVCSMVTAIYLLPVWWKAWTSGSVPVIDNSHSFGP